MRLHVAKWYLNIGPFLRRGGKTAQRLRAGKANRIEYAGADVVVGKKVRHEIRKGGRNRFDIQFLPPFFLWTMPSEVSYY
jgi:hypothetical protein